MLHNQHSLCISDTIKCINYRSQPAGNRRLAFGHASIVDDAGNKRWRAACGGAEPFSAIVNVHDWKVYIRSTVMQCFIGLVVAYLMVVLVRN